MELHLATEFWPTESFEVEVERDRLLQSLESTSRLYMEEMSEAGPDLTEERSAELNQLLSDASDEWEGFARRHGGAGFSSQELQHHFGSFHRLSDLGVHITTDLGGATASPSAAMALSIRISEALTLEEEAVEDGEEPVLEPEDLDVLRETAAFLEHAARRREGVRCDLG